MDAAVGVVWFEAEASGLSKRSKLQTSETLAKIYLKVIMAERGSFTSVPSKSTCFLVD